MVVRAVADVGASRAWATTEVVGGKEEDRPVVGASIGVLVVVAELGTIVGSSSDGSTFFWKRYCCIGLVTATVEEALFLDVVDPST